ncbi:MAG: DMT family transporter [Aquabacterium sp.]
MNPAPLIAEPTDTRRLQGLAFALAGAIAFSGKAILAKLMYRTGADAFAVIGLRMAMALPLFLGIAWWTMRRRPGVEPVAPLSSRERWQIAGLGFCGYYMASTLDFLGLQYISAGLERAILYLNPAVVLLLSALWFHQRVRAPQVVAMVLAYAGVMLVFGHDLDLAHVVAASATSLLPWQAVGLGSGLVFLSAVAYAVYLIGSGRLVARVGSARLIGLASSVACVVTLVQWLAVWLGSGGVLGRLSGLPTDVYLLSLVNATVCTVLPMWMVMRGVALLGAPTASQIGMVGPLSTIWMASIWLDEPVSLRLMAGTLVVLVGVLWLGRPGPRATAG